MEFEGFEAGIVKHHRKMMVLGGVAGRRRESLQGRETASNIVENVRFGAPGALPRTLATYAPSRPVLPGLPGLVLGP